MLKLKLDKVLYIINFPFYILLPNYGCCTGELQHVA